MGIVMLFGIVGRWPIGSSVCVESEIYSGLHMGMLIIWCMSVSSRQLITQHCLIYCQYPTWLTVCGWVGWGAQGKNITVPECPGQVNLFTTTARPSGCVIFTTIARYSGLIHTPRWPAVAGAATTCGCCCFYRVPCATVMSRNAQNQAELVVDYKWRKIVQFADRLEGILSLRRTN